VLKVFRGAINENGSRSSSRALIGQRDIQKKIARGVQVGTNPGAKIPHIIVTTGAVPPHRPHFKTHTTKNTQRPLIPGEGVRTAVRVPSRPAVVVARYTAGEADEAGIRSCLHLHEKKMQRFCYCSSCIINLACGISFPLGFLRRGDQSMFFLCALGFYRAAAINRCPLLRARCSGLREPRGRQQGSR